MAGAESDLRGREMMGYRARKVQVSPLAPLAQGLAIAALPVLVVAVLATRMGKVEPAQGIMLLTLSGVMAVAALAIGGVIALDIWRTGRRGMGTLFRVAVLASLALAYPAYLTLQAFRLPPLNDISTDLDDPPAFSTKPEVLKLRGQTAPRAFDQGQKNAQIQAYPNVRSLILELDQDEAFETVHDAVISLGWRIIEETTFKSGAATTAPVTPVPPRRGQAQRPPVPPASAARARPVEGRIEAIAESRLLRFQEDITIRLRPQEGGVKVDLRSASRVGRHDFGANASRILRLLEDLNAPKE